MRESELDCLKSTELSERPLDLIALGSQSFAAFDATLESPLGLDAMDSPFSQYLVSPMYSDDGGKFLHNLDYSVPLFPVSPIAPPAPTPASSPRKTPTANARASAPPLELSAPVEPRTYLLPSTTSRKRKTSLIERELAKRQTMGEEDIPEDLVAVVEKKRAQNTLSSRKSRMRKQQKVDDLASENLRLKGETAELKARVLELELLWMKVVCVPPM